MDGARLPASGCPHFSPRQTRLLQLGRLMGRRAGAAVGIDFLPIEKRSRRAQECARSTPNTACAYFLVGAGDGGGGSFVEPCALGEPCGAGVGGGFTSCNSTSKISVEFGPMSGPIARSP